MKRYIGLMIVLCCFFGATLAQTSLGLKTGYTKAWMDYGEVPLPDNAIIHINRIHVSALAYKQLNSFLRVGIEPGYLSRGANCEPGFAGGFRGDTKLILNNVELPLMCSAHIPLVKNQVGLMANVGYGVSYTIAAFRETRDLDGIIPTTRERLDFDGFRPPQRWSHGLYGGLGISKKIKGNDVFIKADYHYGFVDIDVLNTSKHRSLQYGLGYLFQLKK